MRPRRRNPWYNKNLPETPKGVNHCDSPVRSIPIPSLRPLHATACGALAALLCLPVPADAQSIPSPYSYLEERQELGVFVGIMDAGTGRFDYGPGGGTVYGIRYGIELSGPLSFEGVMQLVDGERNVVDPGRAEGERVVGQASSRITTIEARLKLTATGRRAWHGLAPFLDFGGGIAIDASPESELDLSLEPDRRFDFGTSFFGTMSGGVRWHVSRRFTLRGDGVFSLWKIDTPPAYANPDFGFDFVSDGEWEWGTAFTLALLYRW